MTKRAGCKNALESPESFNFGYDVVDKIADETPEKSALVWCNAEGEEHIFSFADIKKYSNDNPSFKLYLLYGRGRNEFSA